MWQYLCCSFYKIPAQNDSEFGIAKKADYIFFESSQLEVDDLLWVPQSFPVLNESKLPNGHVIPSDVFPSDHLAIGARLSWKKKKGMLPADSESAATISGPEPRGNDGILSIMTFAQPPHTPRCDCGCVPAIPSLFEMAQLRKEARLQKEREAQTKAS